MTVLIVIAVAGIAIFVLVPLFRQQRGPQDHLRRQTNLRRRPRSMTPAQGGAGRQRRSRLASPPATAIIRTKWKATATKMTEQASQAGVNTAQALPGAGMAKARSQGIAAIATAVTAAVAMAAMTDGNPHMMLGDNSGSVS